MFSFSARQVQSQFEKNTFDRNDFENYFDFNSLQKHPKSAQPTQEDQIQIEQHSKSLILKYLRLKLAQMGLNIHITEYLLNNISEDFFNRPLDIIISDLTERIKEEEIKIANMQLDNGGFAPSLLDKKIQDFEQLGWKSKILNNRMLSQQNKVHHMSPFQEIQQIQQNFEQCPICFSFLQKEMTLQCHHKICKSCLDSYIQYKISILDILTIKCPVYGCSHEIREDEINQILDQEKFQRYLEAYRKKILQSDDTIRWCTRPGCQQYMKGSIFSKTLKCTCGQEVCYKCRQSAHPGIDCEGALDQSYMQLVYDLTIQRCPRCKACIEKIYGCNHVRCLMCSFEFCWLCGARYTFQHFDEYNCVGCPKQQFSKSPPIKRPSWKKWVGLTLDLIFSIFVVPFLPMILICLSVYYPVTLCKRYNRRNYQKYNEGQNCCLILIGMLFFPLFIVFLIITELPILIYNKIKYD